MTTSETIAWLENGQLQRVAWRSSAGVAAPKRVLAADDRITADAAFRLASEGTAILWRGDFQNARQLLQAVARRVDQPPRRKRRSEAVATMPDAFNAYRQVQSQRSRTLNMLLVPMDRDYTIPLRRAPDVQAACVQAYGATRAEACVVSLREVQGLIGAFEWHRKGVAVAALQDRIHPHYGVFAPIRSEYVDLVAGTPLPPATACAFDIGTGTGVLAAVLARRGVSQIVATDIDARALACAAENLTRLGVAGQVSVERADLYPAGRASLVVCNPPWVPARPSSPLEYAIYDPDSRMLRGFLDGLSAHLLPGGEGWLVLSDLAEHLGLRSRERLLAMFSSARLQVLGRTDVQPTHPRSRDAADPLHAARAAETTSLWRLGAM